MGHFNSLSRNKVVTLYAKTVKKASVFSIGIALHRTPKTGNIYLAQRQQK